MPQPPCHSAQHVDGSIMRPDNALRATTASFRLESWAGEGRAPLWPCRFLGTTERRRNPLEMDMFPFCVPLRRVTRVPTLTIEQGAPIRTLSPGDLPPPARMVPAFRQKSVPHAETSALAGYGEGKLRSTPGRFLPVSGVIPPNSAPCLSMALRDFSQSCLARML